MVVDIYIPDPGMCYCTMHHFFSHQLIYDSTLFMNNGARMCRIQIEDYLVSLLLEGST